MTASELLGTWRLLSYEAREASGHVQHPWGEDVSGQLIYDSGGNVSVYVQRNDRPIFAARDPARGTDAEIRAAFEGLVSYFGTYAIDTNAQTVTHHVHGAAFPNWSGHDQVRFYKINGNRLKLSTPPLTVGGLTFEYVLSWERIS